MIGPGKRWSHHAGRHAEGVQMRQVTDSLTRGDAILDLQVTSASDLIWEVKIGGRLGCSDHVLVEFAVLRDMG